MRFIVQIAFAIIILNSCSKNKIGLNTGWNARYHVVGADTISSVYLANSFSPNGDGINDIYNVICSGITNTDFELKIFNKANENIFVSKDFRIGWDGANKNVKASNGIYNFTLRATDVAGYTFELSGNLYLAN